VAAYIHKARQLAKSNIKSYRLIIFVRISLLFFILNVASKHKSAPWFLKQGFFEGIKSFKGGRTRGQAVPTRSLNQISRLLVGFWFSTPKVRPDPVG